MENKKECSQYLSLNSPNRKSYSPNGGVINDLYSLDAFHTRIDEQASANFQQKTCAVFLSSISINLLAFYHE